MEESIESIVSQYQPRSDEDRSKLIDPVLSWLMTSRRKDRFDIARTEFHKRFMKMEEDILKHFYAFEGGPDFIHKDDAWKLACRQRSFVKEACARMVEGEEGEPTAASEAIRDMDVGESVRVIPDYSKRINP